MEDLFDGFFDMELFAGVKERVLIGVGAGVELASEFLLLGVVGIVVVVSVEVEVGSDHIGHFVLA